MNDLDAETGRFITAWMRLRQVIQAANFNRFQQAGLSATQFMTLNVVPREGMTLSQLSRRLNLSAATLSVTVKSLEERRLVRCQRQEGDARKVSICATDEGEQMQNSASAEFRTFVAGLYGGVSKGRRKGLLEGLEEMVRLSEAGQGRAGALPPAGAAAAPEVSLRADGAAPVERSSRRSRRR